MSVTTAASRMLLVSIAIRVTLNPAEKSLLPNARTNNRDYPVPDRKSRHMFHARAESWQSGRPPAPTLPKEEDSIVSGYKK